MDIAGGIYMQIHLGSRDIMGIEGMGFIRGPAKLGNRQTKKNVAHRRIADETNFVNVVAIDIGFFTELSGQVVYAIDYGFVKLAEFFAGLSVGDSAYNIVAEARLGIEGGFGCLALTGGHIDEPGDNSGCTKINGQAENHAGRVLLRILPVNVGLNLRRGVNTFSEDLLLEVSRCGGDCHRQVAFDSILAGKDLSRARVKIYKAFLARTYTAANVVQNNADLARSFD